MRQRRHIRAALRPQHLHARAAAPQAPPPRPPGSRAAQPPLPPAQAVHASCSLGQAGRVAPSEPPLRCLAALQPSGPAHARRSRSLPLQARGRRHDPTGQGRCIGPPQRKAWPLGVHAGRTRLCGPRRTVEFGLHEVSAFQHRIFAYRALRPPPLVCVALKRHSSLRPLWEAA